MNIFYVDANPSVAAECLVDKHVVKMVLESSQLLSTAHRVLDGVQSQVITNGRKKKVWTLEDARENVMYAATHINHPSAVWVRQSVENYTWLVEHLFSLMDEYTYRYGKIHKCQGELSYMLSSPPKNLEAYDWTPMPSCMDEKYIVSDDPIVNYRYYYKFGKVDLHAWKNRIPPKWISE